MNKINKCAPSPWSATLKYVGDPYRNILDASGSVIAEEVPAGAASLITAAPDLLSALIRAHDCINALWGRNGKLETLSQWPDNPVGPTGILHQCSAAINKALKD